jgi:hypothetical protein
MAPNTTGIGSPKRPYPATVSLLDTRALTDATAGDAGEIGHDRQRKHLPARVRQREEGPKRRKDEDLLRTGLPADMAGRTVGPAPVLVDRGDACPVAAGDWLMLRDRANSIEQLHPGRGHSAWQMARGLLSWA